MSAISSFSGEGKSESQSEMEQGVESEMEGRGVRQREVGELNVRVGVCERGLECE